MRYWLFVHSEWEPQAILGVAIEVPSNLLKEDTQGSAAVLIYLFRYEHNYRATFLSGPVIEHVNI